MSAEDAFFALIGGHQDDAWNEFHRHAAEGRLVVQRCTDCDKRRWPAQTACARCQGLGAEWEEIAPTGTVWSFTIAHPPVVEYLSDRVPVTVALVSTDADPTVRILGEVTDGVSSLRIGDRVMADFRIVADGVGVPTWSPVDTTDPRGAA